LVLGFLFLNHFTATQENMKINLKIKNSNQGFSSDIKQTIRSALAHITHKIHITEITVTGDGSNDFDPFSSRQAHQSDFFGRETTNNFSNLTLSAQSKNYGHFNSNSEKTAIVTCQRQGGGDNIPSHKLHELISEAISLRSNLELEGIEDHEGHTIDMEITRRENIEKQNEELLRNSRAYNSANIFNQTGMRNDPFINSQPSPYRMFHSPSTLPLRVNIPRAMSLYFIDNENKVYAELNNIPAKIEKDIIALREILGDDIIMRAQNNITVISKNWLIQVDQNNAEGITNLAMTLRMTADQLREIAKIPAAEPTHTLRM
jgi:hypothetical protein